MPNHIHVIFEIVPTVGAPLVVALDNKNMNPHDNKNIDVFDNKNVVAHNKTNTDAPKNIFTQNQKCNQQQLGQSKPHQLGQPHIKQLGQPQGIAPTITIGNIIGAFKSITTHEYIRGVTNNHWKPYYGIYYSEP